MEVFVILAMFAVYAEWAVLALVFCVGAWLWISRRALWIGVALVVLAGGYMAFLFFTPEEVSSSQKPLVVTTVPDTPFAVPSMLVLHLHGDIDEQTGYDLEDALTLAETGLFRVVLAGSESNDPAYGEAVLAKAPDCAETRSRPQGKDSSFPAKIGDLLFTARTGFKRCAKYVPVAVEMPQRRLDLWTKNPPGEPTAADDRSLLGIMLLTMTEEGNQHVIARRVTRARKVALSRFGFYTYDSRPEYSEKSGDLDYDPDVLSFVLAATHADQSLLPKDGSIPDTDLVKSANTIISGVTSADQKLRVAIAPAGATTGGSGSSRAILEGAKSAFAEYRQLVEGREPQRFEVRVPSDCQTALQAAAGRQAFASICEGALHVSKNRWGDCIFPTNPEAFKERCTDIRKTIWDGSERGWTTLVLGDATGDASKIGISDLHGAAELRRIFVRPEDGLLNLVLVARDSTIWTLEGSIGCVDRVTVVGKRSGVVGIDPKRVQFRDRLNVAYRFKDAPSGLRLDDLLGRNPERTLSTTRNATTAIGERGLERDPCRSRDVVQSLESPRPDQVVTGPSDLVFGSP